MNIDAKYIEDMWGPRCDIYADGCGCCDMWRMWDEIERLQSTLNETVRQETRLWADNERLRGLLRDALPAVQSYSRKHQRAAVAAEKRCDGVHTRKHRDAHVAALRLAAIIEQATTEPQGDAP
jgi:regulator of replication initiation timing